MTHNDAWAQIQNQLTRLSQEPALAPVRPIIERMIRDASTRQYEPRPFELLIELLQRWSHEIRQGAQLEELIKSTLAKGYVQPGWNVDTVHQAYSTTLNFYFKEYEPPQAKPYEVLIVLVAMTSDEAHEIAAKQGFHDCPTNWWERYHASPSEWQPFHNSSQTIAELIHQTLKGIESSQKPIAPTFIDIHGLNQDEQWRLLRKLRRNSCIVIVDAISLRHPVIQREFLHAALDSLQAVRMAYIVPTDTIWQTMRNMTVIVEQQIFREGIRRSELDKDENFETMIGDSRLDKWLHNRVLQLLLEDIRPREDIRNHWQR